nr:hypothetical protein [Frankia sp. Cppng1_Ct_nod]
MLREPKTLRRVRSTRYATPLREGGSPPGTMEADDFVAQFWVVGTNHVADVETSKGRIRAGQGE